MSERISEHLDKTIETLHDSGSRLADGIATLGGHLATLGGNLASMGGQLARQIYARRALLIAAAVLGTGAYRLYQHPPYETVARGEVALRVNQLTGGMDEFRDGAVLVIPRLHVLRHFPLHDQTYRPITAEYQSVEGLTLGMDIAIRYALDPAKISSIAHALPENIGGEVVEPAVQGVVYRTLSRYTVREIFSTKRVEIQQSLETELRPLLEADGIRLHAVQVGKVNLPADYRAGMERLLAEELATEQMRYTLELKDKQVKQSELEAQADKVRREKLAEAAAAEQIIAAKAQAESMQHVLPFKQKQIEQRGLEAEAEKIARIKSAEAQAQARQIEASGEAESRRKLADADAYRIERMGKLASEQLARDGALIQKHPLLIQKTMADKLSDKISVIIAAPPVDGGFIGANLLGSAKAGRTSSAANETADETSNDDAGE